MLYVPLQLNSGLLGSVKKVFHGESFIYDLQNLLLITETCNTQAMNVKRPYGIELDVPFEQRLGH